MIFNRVLLGGKMGRTLYDSFNMPNNTPLGLLESGNAYWQALKGSWFHSGNRATTSHHRNQNPLAVADAGSPDVTITIAVPGGGGECIYFRVKDVNNWLRLRYQQTRTSSPIYRTEYEWKQRYKVQYGGPTNPPFGEDPHTHDYYKWHTSSTSPPSFPETISHVVGGPGNYHMHDRATLGWPRYTGQSRQVQTGTSTTIRYYLYLEQAMNGSITSLYGANFGSSAASSIGVKVQGDTIKVFRNGSEVASRTSTLFMNQTQHGIGLGTSSYGSGLIDDFYCEPL